MNKEQLFDLTKRVKLAAGVKLPIIVGSQSLYGVTSHVPESRSGYRARSYVERLIPPTIIEPLREEWAAAQLDEQLYRPLAVRVEVVLPTAPLLRQLPRRQEPPAAPDVGGDQRRAAEGLVA